MSHDHAHASVPPTGSLDRAFLVGIVLNAGFLIVELAVGLRSHSLGLVADAAHNFGDVLSLLLSWLAVWLAGRQASGRHTYGFRRAGILAALVNGVLLLVAVGGILWEAVQRLRAPEPVQGWPMILVAGLGVMINAVSALTFLRHGKEDLNVRGAFLHLMADAAVSLGVVLAGVGILITGRTWLDPAISLVVGLIVLVGSWPLFRQALDLILDAVPEQVDLEAVRAFLEAMPQVQGLHHLHIWALGTTTTALSVHLIVDQASDGSGLVHELTHQLHDRFHIDHATIQVEGAAGCLLSESHTE